MGRSVIQRGLMHLWFLLFTFLSYWPSSSFSSQQKTQHSDNWAILVDTSRYWFNYRHSVNTLAVYEVVKHLGIPDSHILLMLADYPATDPRNRFPGQLFLGNDHAASVAGADVEVDFRGMDVNAHNFLRVLTGKNHAELGVSPSQMLLSSNTSNVLLYMTGHGGDEFLKFHDIDELGSEQLGAAFAEMHVRGMYGELLVIIDTCQAATMANHIHTDAAPAEAKPPESRTAQWNFPSWASWMSGNDGVGSSTNGGSDSRRAGPYVSPNVVFIASSRKGENSYALHGDTTVGVSTVDRFTGALVKFVASSVALSSGKRGDAAKKPEGATVAFARGGFGISNGRVGGGGRNRRGNDRGGDRGALTSPLSYSPSLQDLFDSFQPEVLHSHAVLELRGYSKDVSRVPVTDFFASTGGQGNQRGWQRVDMEEPRAQNEEEALASADDDTKSAERDAEAQRRQQWHARAAALLRDEDEDESAREPSHRAQQADDYGHYESSRNFYSSLYIEASALWDPDLGPAAEQMATLALTFTCVLGLGVLFF